MISLKQDIYITCPVAQGPSWRRGHTERKSGKKGWGAMEHCIPEIARPCLFSSQQMQPIAHDQPETGTLNILSWKGKGFMMPYPSLKITGILWLMKEEEAFFFLSGIASDKILMFLWIQIDSLEIHTEHMCAGMCWVCALVPKAEPGTQHMVHVQVYAQTVLWRPSRTWHTHVWVCKHVLSVCWYQAQNWAHSTCVIVTHWRYTHRTRVCRHVLRVCSGA